MKKMRRMCCLLLAVLMLITVTGCGREEAPQSFEYTKTETAYHADSENLQVTIEVGCLEDENDRDWAVYDLQQAYLSASDFLGEAVSTGGPIRCMIYAGDGLSQVQPEGLDIYYYETVQQPYVNYMIQALMGLDAPDWLREGLAAYGADQADESLLDSYASGIEALDAFRVEEEAEAEAVTADITSLAVSLYTAGVQEDAIQLGDLLQATSQLESAEEAAQYRGAYCIYAGSFVAYLAEEKGLDAVLKVYQGEEFDAVMGQSLKAAKQAWITNTLG